MKPESSADTVAENRALREMLARVNSVISDQDGDIRKLEARMLLSEEILRKLLGMRDDGFGENYVDLERGVFDCRVTLTDQEVTHLAFLRGAHIDGWGVTHPTDEDLGIA